ncbi:MAG: MFS transporter [Halobacteriaceae archaeon]
MTRFRSVALLGDREFLALAGTAFARSQAYSTILIALALYADVFRTSGVVEGLFGTAFALTQLVVILPLGRTVDTGNAKRWLLAGFLVNVGVFLGFVFVESAVHVVLIRMVQGVGASILWITGATVVGEISPDDEQGRWLGSYNQVAAVSSMVGDLVGGYLLFAHGFTVPYLVLTAITLGAFVLVAVALRDDPGGSADPEDGGLETFRSLLSLPMLRALVGFRFAFSFGKMAVIIFLPIYARTSFGISALAIGWILAGGKLTKGLLQGLVGSLTDRRDGTYRFVAVGALLYGVGTALIPVAGAVRGAVEPVRVELLGGTQALGAPFFALFGAYAVIGVADSIRLPASMSLFVDEGARYDSVASAMSLRSVSWKVGQVVGPVLVGATMDLASVAAGFYLAAGFIAVATAGFAVAARRAHDEPMDPRRD